MKKLLALLIFFMSVPNIFSQNPTDTPTQIIDKYKKQYAPDSRTAVLSIANTGEGKHVVLTGETNLPEVKQKLITEIKGQFPNTEDKITLLPESELGDKIYGIINLSVVNIRKKPDNPEEMLTQSLLGTVVNILKAEKGWCFIQTPDHYLGWVDDDAVIRITEQSKNEYLNSRRLMISTQYAVCYSEPSEKSERLRDLVLGNILTAGGTSGDYYKVTIPTGQTGYILKSAAVDFNEWIASVHITQKSIIDTAKDFVGIPYMWGGTSVKGVDCSGFTKSVYYLNGIILPRDASQQALVGELVDTTLDLNNLQPGDLLFFGRHAAGDKPERVTHVGIYKGNGEFMHSSGFVKVNSLIKEKENFSEYRYNMYLKAKRMITRIGDPGITPVKDSEYYFNKEKNHETK